MPKRRPLPRPVTPADLRERASDFRRLADAARDEIVHQELLRLAETYLREADELERRGGGAPSDGVRHEPYLAALFE